MFEIFPFRKCRVVPKNVKWGTLWTFLTYILLQNIKELERGTHLRHLKNFRKNRTMPKKIERVSSGFVGYGKKVKNERGTLCTNFRCPDLAYNLSSFSSFCCRKVDQSERDCSLTKKKKKN